MTNTAVAPGGQVVGRERELAAVERLLRDACERFSVLLLEGEAGIGKTAVFREAVRLAEVSGFHVLACRPASAEATLSLAALADLLGAVPDDAWDALPAPQRRALDVALLRTDPGDSPVDQRAIAAGFRSLITGLSTVQPVLLALDDIQWVDAASATVLAFVLRRLGTERIGLVATRRLPEAAQLDIAANTPPHALAREQLGPLSLGALQRVIKERLGAAFPRSTLVRVHTASYGNPLFALEISRLLTERGTPAVAAPLPVPDDVRDLVRDRVAALPAATRDVLLAVALLARPATETLTRTFSRPIEADLEPAERAAVAARDGDVVAFAHPLYAAAVVAIAPAAERSRMHRRLAESVPEAEERARHLARATQAPDATTAQLLEDAALSARARGGLPSAAELLESARKLTPHTEADAARRRGIGAANLHIRAGDRDHATSLLNELLSESLTSAQRAEALRLLAELAYGEEDLEQSERLLLEALEVDDDPRRSARALLDLMHMTANHRMDFERAAELGDRAVDALRGSEDGPLLAEALAYSAMTTFLAAKGVDWNKVERALALEDADRIAPIGLPPRAIAGLLLVFVGRHGEARETLNAVRERLVELGDEGNLAYLLVWLSWLETRSGNLDAAGRFVDESMTYAALTGNRSLNRLAIAQRAVVEAHLGNVAAVRERCTDSEALDERGAVQVALWVTAALALLELSLGNAESAWHTCRPLVEAVEASGIGEPVPLFFLPDALEALVMLGELERAEAIIDEFERRGRELGRGWALATGGRCRGLLLAARGDLTGALAALERALAEHERIEMPFERARTVLAKGVITRRARQQTAARRDLEEAAQEFDRIGARLWSERARSELERLGGRRPRREGELTPTEQRVVELAAEGLSNKEIAARFVVSVHTVEVHLSNAYAKLGVRSRAQLARRLAGRQ